MRQVLLVALISSKKKESSSLLEGRELRSFEEKEGVKRSFWREEKPCRIKTRISRQVERCRIKSFKCRGQFTTKLIQFMLQDRLAYTGSWEGLQMCSHGHVLL